MIDRIIEEIINKFNKHYGYRIIELKRSDSNETFWGVIRDYDNITHCIILSEGDKKDNLKSAVSENQEIFGDAARLDIIKIFVVQDEFDSVELPVIFEGDKDIIVIDKNSKSIIYSNCQHKEFIKVIDNILNELRSSENKDGFKPWVTYSLIGINIIMFIISVILSGSIMDISVDVLVFLGAKDNSLIAQGEYYRLITCMFLHGGLIHIALNMFSLNAIGPLIEKVYGRAKFIFIYMISGIFASLSSFIFSYQVSIGASGAIFGILGATLIFAYKMKNRIGKSFLSNVLMVIFINIMIGFSIANVDKFAHLGGLISGILLSLIFIPEKLKSKAK